MSGRFNNLDSTQRFDDYELLEKIGKGSMGIVYKARHIFLGDEVALKIMHPLKDGETGEAQERFKRECRALGKLRKARHPNLIRVDTAGIYRNHPYLAMDYIDGSDLQKLIHAGIQPLLAIRIVADTVSALEVSHRCGIIHRDIKPANIMVTKQQVTKLVDFGISKLLDYDDGITTRYNIDALGTLGYMSPEQLSALVPPYVKQPLDKRADIYSAGKVLYYALTKEKVIDPKNAATRTPAYHYDWTLPEPESQDIYFDIFPILRKMLAKDPDKRYDSATETSQELFNFLQCQETTTHSRIKLATMINNALLDQDIDPSILQGPFAFIPPAAYQNLTGICINATCKNMDEPLIPRRGTRKQYTIGRSPKADIQLIDPTVSREHAVLEQEFRVGDESSYRIRDRGSSFGLYVNGKKTESRLLSSGDVTKFSVDSSLVFSTTHVLVKQIRRNRPNLTHYLETQRHRN